MAKYYITPTLLNSWQYNIKNGTLEDFIKVLNKEEFEPSESILKGFKYEKYMQKNFEETLNGAYQVKVSKEYGDYLLYGIIDCLKGGIIYDYKYTQNYEVGKFFNNYQTLMYLEMVPEAKKMIYLITNKFDKEIIQGKFIEPVIRICEECEKIDIPVENRIDGLYEVCSRCGYENKVSSRNKYKYEIGDIFREEYTKDMFPETMDSILHKFEQWLKQYNLFDLYTEKWKCKY